MTEGDSPENEELIKLNAAERDCYAACRSSFNAFNDYLEQKLKLYYHVTLEEDLFDRARSRAKETALTHALKRQSSQNTVEEEINYLGPFLVHVRDPLNMKREEAQRVRDACLKALKDRLLERANIIQERLNQENKKLAKKQEQFQRSQREGDTSGEEEFEQYSTEAMFRIQILEQRLASHEESALKKFADLDNKLANDPRLSILRTI